MSRVLITKVVTLILIMLSGLILIVSTPNTSSADHSSSRATPTPVPTSTPLPTPTPILILIEENISITNTQDQSGIQSGKVIEENISTTNTQYQSGIQSGKVIEENISITNIQDQSGIQSGKVIEENISITEEMNPPDEMLLELTNIAEEMQSREASREQSSQVPTEERDRRDPFGRGTGDVQSDVSDSGSCNSSNSNEGLLLFSGLLIPAFLRIRKKYLNN